MLLLVRLKRSIVALAAPSNAFLVSCIGAYLRDLHAYSRDLHAYLRDLHAYLRDLHAYLRDLTTIFRHIYAIFRHIYAIFRHTYAVFMHIHATFTRRIFARRTADPSRDLRGGSSRAKAMCYAYGFTIL